MTTMDDLFDTPSAPGGGIKLKEHIGELFLVTVHSLELQIATDFGVSDAIRADVEIIDGAHAGEQHHDVLLWGQVITQQLKRSIGRRVLGRVSQGIAKPGKSAPWLLAEATDDDKRKAQAFLSGARATRSDDTPPF